MHTKYYLCGMSVYQQIEAKVKRAKEGTLFVPDDFRQFGNKTVVHTALHRMVKKSLLTRISHGIYAKPRISKLLNKEVLPDVEKVARAIARRDKARLLPTGAYALYALGLSTQIPLKVVYYTDGKARKIKVGQTTILFKKTTPKNLALRGRISKLVVQAMKEIGKDKLLPKEEKKILDILKKEKIQDLKHDIALAPQWIAEIMARALK